MLESCANVRGGATGLMFTLLWMLSMLWKLVAGCRGGNGLARDSSRSESTV